MQGDTQSFIVRIWFEETEGQNGTLVRRGSIEHVSGQTQIYFRHLEQILAFIEEHTCVHSEGSTCERGSHILECSGP